MKRTNSRFICSNGDGGHGWDNSAPWYQAYYSSKDTPQLKSEIITIAASLGYNLKTDMKMTSDLNLPGYRNSEYLTAGNGQKELSVRIAHNGDSVALYCGTGSEYGKEITPSQDQVITDFRISLPG